MTSPHYDDDYLDPPQPELIRAGTPRIVVFNRWASAVALTLGILLMLTTLITTVWIANTLGGIAARLNTNTTTPGPLVTGCPFGDDQCGG